MKNILFSGCMTVEGWFKKGNRSKNICYISIKFTVCYWGYVYMGESWAVSIDSNEGCNV